MSEAINQKKTLAQQIKEQAEMEARQAAETSRRALAQEIASNRRDFNQNRQQIEQDSFMRSRNLQGALSSRGLATSGVAQLGEVQNQLAKGQSVNSLAQRMTQTNQLARQGETDVAQNLATQLGRAGIAYGQQMSDISDQETEEENLRKQREQESVSTLIAAFNNPDLSNEQKDLIFSTLSPNLSDSVRAQVQAAKDYAIGEDTYTAGIFSNTLAPSFNVNGTQMSFGNWDEAINTVAAMYANREYSNQVNIVRVGNSLKFKTRYGTFDTYNQAEASLKMSGTTNGGAQEGTTNPLPYAGNDQEEILNPLPYAGSLSDFYDPRYNQ
jgi:hypothetical protein